MFYPIFLLALLTDLHRNSVVGDEIKKLSLQRHFITTYGINLSESLPHVARRNYLLNPKMVAWLRGTY